MKTVVSKPDSFPGLLRENHRIFLAVVASGAAILLMILAEMKFFGS
jgi:hypothetical protein